MLDAEDKAALHVPDGGVAVSVLFRDEEGYINPDFVASVADAIEEADGARLQALVEDFESDLGDLLEALTLISASPPDRAPRLGLDFTALTEVDEAIREEILEGLNTSTLAEGVRELDSTTRSPFSRAWTRRTRRKSSTTAHGAAVAPPALPRLSGGKRRPAHADGVHRRPAVLDRGTDDRLHARHRGPARDLLRDLRDRSARTPARGVALDRLLRSKRPVTIQEIMDDEPDRVEATQHQEVARPRALQLRLRRRGGRGQRLVGVMMVDDIVDVLEEEADADIKQLGGVKSDEELSDTVLYTQRSRFPGSS